MNKAGGLMGLRFLGALLCAGMLATQILASGCDYARMRDDEAVDFYEMEFPRMPEGVLPLGGGVDLMALEPKDLENPLAASPSVVAAGKTAYGYYCAQCHGRGGDGRGTVGQSFAPLPTDLRGEYVQQQPDGQLFYRIGKGYKRHPTLASTISVQDRWAVVIYMRSLSKTE